MTVKSFFLSGAKLLGCIVASLYYWLFVLPGMWDKGPKTAAFAATCICLFLLGLTIYTAFRFVKDGQALAYDLILGRKKITAKMKNVLIQISLTFAVILMNFILWYWMIPMFWKQGSSASFDVAIALALFSVIASPAFLLILYKKD